MRKVRILVTVHIVFLLLISASLSATTITPALSYSTYVGMQDTSTIGGPAILAANGAGDVCALVYGPWLLVRLQPDGSFVYAVATTVPTPPGAHEFPTAALAIDSSGDCYVAAVGTITPTPGVFQTTPKSGQFVEKFGPTGSIVYATYLGGSGQDYPGGLTVDAAGNAYLTGVTTSNDFPTKNAYQPVLGGENDAYVAVLNPTATALVYSTYLGGSGSDSGAAIAVDSSSNAYVTGITGSSNFPTVAPFQSSLTGGNDAFVTKLNSSGVPVYSTFLSGTGGSQGSGIAADSSGDAYVTGSALSADFPLKNPVQSTWQSSIFVTEFNPSGSALVYSTFLGTDTEPNFPPTIAADASGQAYIAGGILTAGTVPLVSPLNSAPLPYLGEAGFATVLSSGGKAVAFSTYLWSGTTGGIAVDSAANIYVSGLANPFPIVNAYNGIFNIQLCSTPPQQQCTGYNSQPFVLKITPSATGPVLALPSAVEFSELVPVGGTSDGYSELVLVANASSTGTINISNISISGDFTETNNCPSSLAAATNCVITVTFAPTAGGTRTGTLTITDDQPGSPQLIALSGTATAPQLSIAPSRLTFGSQTVGTTSSPQIVTLTNSGGAALTISHISVSGNFNESNTCGQGIAAGGICQISVTFTPTTTGTLNGALSITDNAPGSPQTVPLSGTGGTSDFSIGPTSGSPNSQTISPGQSATFSLSLTPVSGFSGTVNLSCGITPKETPAPTCTVPSSANVTGGKAASVQVTVGTTAATGGLMSHAAGMPPGTAPLLWTLALLGSGLLFSWKQRARPAIATATFAMVLLAGCGGSTSSQPGQGTPAGTYTATVMASAGNVSHSTTLTVVVQ
ncbi:MAG TPA: choice-of-anchor D domain-containing protein [Terriglobales bacterium]|nr:choice-of-anchor D domain-containing protein [Terriglobales bacterium]